jgi:hypothetical protein
VRWSILIVAALIAIGIAAAVDALRGSGRASPPETTTRETAASPPPAREPAESLRGAGVTGTLYFTLRTAEGCVLDTLALPDLEEGGASQLDWCGFDVSPEGHIVTGPPCPGRRVDMHSADGSLYSYRGCAPAWRPEGTLTFVRNGDVVTSTETLVRKVARFARGALGRGSRLSVQELAWLTDVRLAVRVASPAVGTDVVIVLERGRPVSEPLFLEPTAQLHISHATEEILVATEGGGVQVFDPGGNFVSASRFQFGSIGAAAYSPNGRWVALARQGNLCIYEETDPPPRERFPLTCLPFDVVDLAWS